MAILYLNFIRKHEKIADFCYSKKKSCLKCKKSLKKLDNSSKKLYNKYGGFFF